MVQRIVNFSLTYIDESVIAYTFRTGNENVFDAAKSGIIIYCQSWKALLKNAVALTLLVAAALAKVAWLRNAALDAGQGIQAALGQPTDVSLAPCALERFRSGQLLTGKYGLGAVS